MTEQPTDFDAIVRADLAIEIMNRGRGLISARLHDIGDGDPAEAERLRSRRRDLLGLQHDLTEAQEIGQKGSYGMWADPRVKAQ
ncbi:hypothetical protein C8J34_11817 [Rhizobium sp. PP-F2F-G36]|nr:hypothetical protein C8J34_11817 [Rhizobium sp. PP-F2F-G36]